MIAGLDRATFSTMEQQPLEFMSCSVSMNSVASSPCEPTPKVISASGFAWRTLDVPRRHAYNTSLHLFNFYASGLPTGAKVIDSGPGRLLTAGEDINRYKVTFRPSVDTDVRFSQQQHAGYARLLAKMMEMLSNYGDPKHICRGD
jgi:hypothetical protein